MYQIKNDFLRTHINHQMKGGESDYARFDIYCQDCDKWMWQE